LILWKLRGYSDLEGEFEGGELTCSIERSEDGYRLIVEQDGEIQLHESHGAIETARGKAEIIKAELLSKGFTDGATEGTIEKANLAVLGNPRRLHPHVRPRGDDLK
jgi:hypothetical protein